MHSGPLLGRKAGGSYHAGLWMQPRQPNQPGGVWLMAEETVWTRSDDLVALFAQWSWRWGGAPDVIESSAAGGVVVQGVIPSRPNDLVSVAVSSVSLAAGRETAFELLYKVAVLESTMWLLDVQYISRVAGIRSANGWVATTRLSIQL